MFVIAGKDVFSARLKVFQGRGQNILFRELYPRVMASAVARAYSEGLGLCPSEVQGQSSWSGSQGQTL